MENISNKEPLTNIVHRLLYHVAQLAADGRFEQLQQAADAMLARGRTLRGELEAQAEAMIRAMALRTRRDLLADRAVKVFENELFGLVNRNRKDPRYVFIFGLISMGRLVRLPYADEINQLRQLIRQLDDPMMTPLRDKHQPLLLKAADELQAALDQVKQAADDQARERTYVMVYREDAARLLRANYGELLSVLVQDKEEAESFFLSMRHSEPTADEEPAPVGPPAS